MTDSEKYMERSIQLGRRIRAYRKRAGFTIAQLAALADVAPTTLADIERGKGNPRYDTLCSLSEGLGLPVALLVQHEEGILPGIYIEFTKELLKLFNELADKERQRIEDNAFMSQRMFSWKGKE